MDWSKLQDFSDYEKEIPCVNCDKMAQPTVAGNHWKCHECKHIFNVDGSPIGVECTCLKCNPEHDPLAGKTKGKKAELVLPDEDKKEPRLRREPKRKAKRLRK